MALLDHDEARAYVSPSPDYEANGRRYWIVDPTTISGDGTGFEPVVSVSDGPRGEITPTQARRLAVALLYAADEADPRDHLPADAPDPRGPA